MATPATKETLDAVVNTLCEPSNFVLNFHLGGIFVTPARFKGVADAIKAGKISVEIGGNGRIQRVPPILGKHADPGFHRPFHRLQARARHPRMHA